MEHQQRIQFESNLDELVEVSVRFGQRTNTLRRQRVRSIWTATLAFTASLFVVATMVSGASSAAVLVPVSIVATAFGIVFGFFYRSIYDWSYRSRVRKFVEEQVGERRTWTCEIELRPQGVWVRDHGVEMMFAWPDATSVDDSELGVELRFLGGIVLARNRAFATSTDRQTFIDHARTLASSKVLTNTSEKK